MVISGRWYKERGRERWLFFSTRLWDIYDFKCVLTCSFCSLHWYVMESRCPYRCGAWKTLTSSPWTRVAMESSLVETATSSSTHMKCMAMKMSSSTTGWSVNRAWNESTQLSCWCEPVSFCPRSHITALHQAEISCKHQRTCFKTSSWTLGVPRYRQLDIDKYIPLGEKIVCVTNFYFPATWAATCRLQRIYLCFRRLGAVMQGTYPVWR